MNAITTSLYSPTIILTDILILALVYFIPALSHIGTFQLYTLEPMRWLLLIGFLLSANNKNAYFLAVTIPLFSMWLTGHPPFFKSLLISAELLVNMLLLIYCINKTNWLIPLALIVSITVSKCMYYALKYIFIKMSLIEGALVTTSLLTQLGTLSVTAIVFSFFYKRKKTAQ
jgi:hypothetical protein